MLSVAQWVCRRLPFLLRMALHRPKTTHCVPPGQDRSRRPPVRAADVMRARAPSTDSTHAFRRKGSCLGETESYPLRSRGPCFTRPARPASSVALWSRVPSYLLPCSDDAPKSTFSDGREGPVTGLCNQLVVTSVRAFVLFPRSRAFTLRPARPARCVASTLGVTFPIVLSTTTPDSRCRHFWPRMAGRLVPPYQL